VLNPVPIADKVSAGDPAITEVGFNEVITGVGVGLATVRLATGETL
jgi:hypothetical protein